MLLGGTAVILSPLGSAGAFLAAMVGLDTAIAAADSFRRLAGRDPYPARRVPVLLGATAVSSTAAATLGGLGATGVRLWSFAVTALAASGYGLVLVARPLVRAGRR